ncbi:HEPN domain-containing protein [Algoriphagus sp. AGSA1]|uniref:HEPN domain-containing protein n=1 Tax=Algoriphagus sp. AGSA1 TaxID=2907213 RepID=UPI001F435ABF|nr:HEPN domain-containing protein [Algoriphagus sp. AGSA1]MCE7053123.1 HEPN domain-containing protein [Algoriphagus sp. AGSA1]
MIPTAFDFEPFELFESYSEESIKNILWDLHKSSVIYSVQQLDTSEEVENNLYFWEMLMAYIRYGMKVNQGLANAPQDKKESQILCDALKILLCPKAIYLHENKNTSDLYVLLPFHTPGEHDQIEAVIGLLLKDRPSYQIHCINVGYLTKCMADGTPFFLEKILSSSPVYLEKAFEGLPQVSDENLQTIKAAALARLNQSLEKSEEFFRIAQTTSSEMKLFFLHQSAELALRGLLVAWEKLEKKTHELKVLLRLCSKYIPELSDLFSGKEEALSVLDGAYCKARYNGSYKVADSTENEINECLGTLLGLCAEERKKFELNSAIE